MANIDHEGLKYTNEVHTGTFGNASGKPIKMSVPSGSAIADVVRFVELPAGTVITDFREVHANIGAAGATMSFGYQATDGTDNQNTILMAATSIAAAGNGRMILPPVTLVKDVYIVGVIAGGATDALGDIDIVLNYIYKGQ